MSLSTHVLDTAEGRPARGITVTVDRAAAATDSSSDHAGGWIPIGGGTTDADGRVPDLLGQELGVGAHRLTFATGPYFAHRDVSTFWGDVVIIFVVTDPTEHHHVPLLLSPFGYSTYRGS